MFSIHSGVPSRTDNCLDPDQARHFVGSDLGINCFQRLSAYEASRQRVNMLTL